MIRRGAVVGVPSTLSCCAVRSSSRFLSSSMLTMNGLTEHKHKLVQTHKALQLEFDAKTAIKKRLDAQALRFPDIAAVGSFGYLVCQTGLLFYWVYFRFDWNLVEPITYLLSYSVVWLGLAAYYATGREFTFDNIRSLIAERKAKRLYQKECFDVERYYALKANVEDVERQLLQLKNIR